MVNDKMPEYCVERAARILNEKKKPLNGSKVLVLGVAYKADIDDYRESPALDLIDIFKRRGADVDFYDPYISEYKYHGELHKGLGSVDGTLIGRYDLVVIAASHSNVDYDMINKNASSVFDTKNAMKKITERDKIEVL